MTARRIALAVALLGLASLAAAQEAAPVAPGVDWNAIVKARNWDGGAMQLRRWIIDTAAAQTPEQAVRATDEAFYRYRVCRAFPTLEQNILNPDERNQLIATLLENAVFTRLLLDTLTPADDTGKAFVVVRDLLKSRPAQVKAMPALAVACAVVYDTAAYSPESVADLVTFYARRGDGLVFSPQKLSPDLLAFVVGGNETMEEREWASSKVRIFRRPGSAFDTPREPSRVRSESDVRSRRTGAEEGGRYDLATLYRQGAELQERADFAVDGARAIGLPAVVMTSPHAMRVNPRWVASLEERGGALRWEETAGKLTKEIEDLVGVAESPAWRTTVSRNTLRRLAQRTPAVTLSDRLVGLAGVATSRDMRFGDTSPISTQDIAVALKLLGAAVAADATNEAAWAALAKLGGDQPAAAGDALKKTLGALLTGRAPKDLATDPAVCADVIIALVNSRALDDEDRLAALQRALSLFRARPRELGVMVLEMARQLRLAGRDTDAFKQLGAYVQSAGRPGPVLADALRDLRSVGDVLRQQRAVVGVLQAAFKRQARPSTHNARLWSVWRTAGLTLADALRDAGEQREAETLERSITRDD